jgi:hypothetical protein
MENFDRTQIEKILIKPKGEAHRKYGHHWNLIVDDVFLMHIGTKAVNGNLSSDVLNYFLQNLEKLFGQDHECRMNVSKDNLSSLSNGKIRDFKYLTKVLNALKQTTQGNKGQSSIDYKLKDSDTISIILRLREFC